MSSSIITTNNSFSKIITLLILPVFRFTESGPYLLICDIILFSLLLVSISSLIFTITKNKS